LLIFSFLLCSFFSSLLYSKDKDKEAKGCTVDFLTDLENEIALSVALVHFEGIGLCLKKSDINSTV